MKTPDEIKQKKMEKLADQGYELVATDEFDAALDVAKQLEDLCYSAAFDIAAQAHAGKGDLAEAIKTLERGVKLAPAAWLNWQLLGNYRSDLERYAEANEAYSHALECPGVQRDSIALNQAILARRQGNLSLSLQHLDSITDSALELHAAGVRLNALQDLGYLDDAVALATRLLDREWDIDAHGTELGYIAATLGRINLQKSGQKPEVRNWAFRSLSYDPTNSHLLALIRDIDARYSDGAKYFRLLIHCSLSGTDPDVPDAKGFYVKYDVVSDTAEEGLNICTEFESEYLPALLEISESETLEPRPQDPKGVYWRGTRAFYENE